MRKGVHKWTEGQSAVDRKHRWTDAQKVSAVAVYMQTANAVRTEEITGIPAQTIRAWKAEPWWKEVSDRIIKEQDEEITTNFSKIVKKAQEKVLDRIENGDEMLIKSKSGWEKVRKMMSGRDLSTVLQHGVASRNLLLDRPTSRIEKISVEDRLKKLSEEFKRYSKAKTIEHEENGETEQPK